MAITNPSYPSYDLPNDVFEPGEVRPTRPVKTKTVTKQPPAKKRGFEAANLEVCLRSSSILMIISWT